jgi:hypothetical protein
MDGISADATRHARRLPRVHKRPVPAPRAGLPSVSRNPSRRRAPPPNRLGTYGVDTFPPASACGRATGEMFHPPAPFDGTRRRRRRERLPAPNGPGSGSKETARRLVLGYRRGYDVLARSPYPRTSGFWAALAEDHHGAPAALQELARGDSSVVCDVTEAAAALSCAQRHSAWRDEPAPVWIATS